jgi:predicted peptidase
MTHRLLAFISLFTVALAGCRSRDASTATVLPSMTVPIGGGFVLRTLVDSGITYKYQVFVPGDFTPARKWPVILYLHGNGEKGSDGGRQTEMGLGPVVRAQRATFPAIVVFPQSPEGSWPKVHTVFRRVAMAALEHSIGEFSGDRERIYLAGISYGAVIGFEMLYDQPTPFAAFVSVAQSGYCCIPGKDFTPPLEELVAAYAPRLGKLPIWVFRGASDTLTPPSRMHYLVDTFRSHGTPIRFTEYEGAGHDVWERAYATPELYSWLFVQKRTQ